MTLQNVCVDLKDHNANKSINWNHYAQADFLVGAPGRLKPMLKTKKRLNKNSTFLVNLLLLFSLLIHPAIVLGSDVLEQLYVLDNLKFNSFASDGKHFIFTRYDTTGNKYELVFYDLKNQRPVITVPDLPWGTKYLFSDDQYIYVHNMSDRELLKKLFIIDKNDVHHRKTIDLEEGGIKEVFTTDNKIYVMQNLKYNKDLCSIYGRTNLNKIASIEINNSKTYHTLDNKIIGIGNQIIVYDHTTLNPINVEDNKLQCQFGMSGVIKGRLFFSDICGKIYEYDLNTYKRKTFFDMGALDIRSGLHKFESLNFDINDKGLLIALHTNKQSYPKLIDIKSGKLLKTLVLKDIPDYIMLDNESLYFIYSESTGKKSKIESYSINTKLLYSEAFYAEHLKKEHERALQVYRQTKDFYKSIEILENANIQLLIKGDREFDDASKAGIINDYAYFLSLAYDRYNEAIPLLEEVIRLSPDRPSAYINLADTYYKVYQYENQQNEVLEKVKDYYDTYRSKMNTRAEANRILKRIYSAVTETPLVKELNIDVMGINLGRLLFWKDRIFAADGCYDRYGYEYLSIDVYNRDDYSLLNKLRIIGCDNSQQDFITSLYIKDTNLYVRTEYRYPDEERPNVFIFALSDYELLKQYHDESGKAGEKLWGWLDLSFADYTNVQYLNDFIRSGKKFESMHGSYDTNNKKYLITHGLEREKKFYIYNLQTLAINKNIELMKEWGSFYLFDDLDKVAIQYFSPVKTMIEIYDIKSKQRRQVLSLPNDPGGLVSIIPVLTTFKQYLIIGHRRDIIIYDAKRMQIAEVVKNVISEFKTEEERKYRRMNNLIVDKEKLRLLIFSLSARPNYFIDLGFLRK